MRACAYALAIASATTLIGCHFSGSTGSAPPPYAARPAQPPPGYAPYAPYAPAPGYPLGYAPPPPPPTGPSFVESIRGVPASARQHGWAPLVLPGTNEASLVPYETVESEAVTEGDILLGPVNELMMRYAPPYDPSSRVFSAVSTNNKAHLWPGGVIPYEIDGTAASQAAGIRWAIAQLNPTELELRPRTNERDFVRFMGNKDSCSSYVGRRGGAQRIDLGGCSSQGSIVHEVMHAAGFWHEQSRNDRDSYITISWADIDEENAYNFEKRTGVSRDIGAYDYDSIMHYSGRAFSRTGRPTIIPNTPGIRIGQREGLSAKDKAGIRALYGGGVLPPPPPPAIPTPTPRPVAPVFHGSYTSTRGEVRCAQSGPYVTCQQGSTTFSCVAKGSAALDCTWTGGGPGGRAFFQRSSDGSLAGMWGDAASYTSRGSWVLTPRRM